MQKCAHLVELEKCCQTHIYLQNFDLIQPRTSPPKIVDVCKKLLIALVLLTFSPEDAGALHALPGQAAAEEVQEHVPEGLDVVAARLLDSLVRVH